MPQNAKQGLDQLFKEVDKLARSSASPLGKLLPKSKPHTKGFLLDVCIVALSIRCVTRQSLLDTFWLIEENLHLNPSVSHLIDAFLPSGGLSGIERIMTELRKV